ncbi:MAG TPA: hypothetical protein PLR01_01130 [Bacteroidales bacterium]|nr:hypothetical protein [Bacteroidales bacterium]HPM00525.1 hypothetical protein [Candidatus Cloacimonadota bacterium]
MKTKIIFSIILLATALAYNPCNAIPAFARKYQMSCTVCHSPAMPRIKGFGEEFAGNGFRLKDTDAPRYFVSTGDDKLSLLRELPLAIRLEGHVMYNDQSEAGKEFGFPYGLKILSGGEISKHLSYYFYFYMSEQGEVAGVEDAFLAYNDFLGTGINITAGQFQVCDPLYKRELRLMLEDYVIYTLKPGTSAVSLKYDRGIIIDYGIESTGTGFVAEIVNGNGIHGAGKNFLFDKDKYKNYFLKGSQSIGKFADIGIFGYYGKEELEPDGLTSTVLFWGPNLTLDFGEKFILNMQYARRSDSKVVIEGEVTEIKSDVFTHGGFAEAIFAPKGDMSNWYLALLGNWVDSELDALDYSSVSFSAGYMLRRNVRLVGEYTRQFANEPYGKASIGFVAAF